LAIAIKCFGVSVSYLVITGSLMPQIVQGFFPNTSQDSIWLMKNIWITIGMITVIPLCFLRRLDSLRYTSAFSLVSVVYLFFVVVLFYLNPSPEMPPKPALEDLEWFRFDSGFVTHFPIFVFAFTCHQNVFSC
jgi:amino acid permease